MPQTPLAKEFEDHFRCFYRPLSMYALRYTEDLDDAEDIVQQAFADVWEKLSEGMRIGNFKAYMYQTVRNRSLNLVAARPEHGKEEMPDTEEECSEEDRILRSERDARLWTAIDRLPTERKKIFLLSKRDGLTYQEIAEELGLSVKTVEHQISKALKTLRETALRLYAFFFLH
ncbi:MAG: RNA polymerase sigma-70 factor [Bacteroidales bacterium]|nr:RNA polymerase sigma-70 factor [Bacteroidales bacterium]